MKELQGITPEIIAAISASIGIVFGDNGAKPIKMLFENWHGGLAVRINRTHRVWIDAGRQNNMNNRLVR
ncbi:hypothetical protein SPSIL_057070 [Sporomusa silvacetica DSM 10669]|uniref:Uncharacterized protein n=1 Tax=Sporomusa silvacetica DSM 10669 TaxID=1123289 RepID=A0ABZ3IVC9_9FIRM|nr:hypothetical protein [Sporomusa silvacetica]OZC15198.1 hypothetical protein SPSIL_42720 [Sporomusa silvacetica DSM 10669]